MSTGKAKYTKEFNNYGLSEWIGIEIDFDGEDPKEKLSEAKKLVIEFFEENKKGNNTIKYSSATVDISLDLKIEEELKLCYSEIDKSNSPQDCYDISKKYGFHLRPEIKEYINNKFTNKIN